MTNISTSPRHRLSRQSTVRLLSCLWMLMLWTQGLRAADEVTVQRLGNFDTAGYAMDVQVVSNLAYVAVHFAGIQVLEVSDPANIQPLGGFYTGDYALGIWVDGHRAYVASRDAGLRVLDVSDPTNIVHLGSFGTSDYAVNVQTAGSIAYLVDGDNGLLVLDVSDPGQIGQLGSYYPGIDTRAVHVVGNLAYLAIDSGLLILDVINPREILPLGGYDTWGAQAVELVRNLAYVASGTNGLQVLDVSNPRSIQHLGSYPASTSIRDVVVQGHLAVVTDDTSGLQILDVSDPGNIRWLGGYDTDGQALSVQVVGNLLYLADGAGLQILQMSGLPVSRPRVVLEPTDQFAHLGESATFQLVAAGDEPLAYQWRKDGQASVDGARITGATTPRLTIQTLEPADGGLYSAVVSNAYGSVTSAVARLALNLASVDAGFDPRANYGVNSIVVQTDGKIVVGGSFTSLTGQPRNRIARLNADGTLDPEFNPGLDGGESPCVQTLAIQPDGKILVGGRFTTIGGQPRLNLARLHADGTLDAGFDPGIQGGHTYWSFADALVLQADGKILVGGVFTNLAGQARQNIGRLNSDGTLDESFDPGAENMVLALASQPDGKILVGGGFTTLGGQPRNFLGRLNADGTLDNGFNPAADDYVSSLAVQPDGKILVGNTQGDAPDLDIVRLNADGSLDITFHRTPIDDPGDDGAVNTLALQADGKILVGGGFTMSAAQPRNNLGRLYADGTLDDSFNPGAGNWVQTMALQPDGKILVGGLFSTLGGQARPNLGRLNNTEPATQTLSYDGSTATWLRGGSSPEVWRTTLDYSMDAVTWMSLGAGTRIPGGWQWTEVAVPTNALLRARGFVAGSGISEWFVETTTTVGAPVIVTQPASQHREPGENVSLSVTVTGTHPIDYQWWKDGIPQAQATGAVLTLTNLQGSDAGYYSVVVSNAYASVTSAVALLTVNLVTVDAGFDVGADDIVDSHEVYSLALQTDGKLLVGGYFLTLGGQPRPNIARLNADGALDIGFNPGPRDWFSSVRSLAIQTDGKILVGGWFNTLGGQPRTNIGRLNPDGTLDSAFDWSADGSVHSLTAQADGKILVGGHFTTLGGQPRNSLARLNVDGTLDREFDPEAEGWVYSLAVQADGKILVGGRFSTLGGQPRHNMGRLNADGTLDLEFDPGAGGEVLWIGVCADGKIVVGHSDVSAYILRRLNADGSPDPAFNPVEFQPNDEVQALALQTDGKILVGGGFKRVAGRTRNGLLRLNADGTMDPTFDPVVSGRDGAVFAVAVQADGKIVAGGDFGAVNGQPHQAIARLNNTEPATQSLSCDGSAATWLRGGSSPEVWRTTLDYSMDAVTWTSLGAGTRINGGWRWTEVAVPTNALLRARGFVAGSGISEWFVESLLPTFPQTAPAIVTGDGSLGVSSSRFGFNVSGVDGQVVVIESSSNLVHWTSLETNALSNGLFCFGDPSWAELPARFYRVRLWP